MQNKSLMFQVCMVLFMLLVVPGMLGMSLF